METRQFFGTDGIRGPVGGPIICGHFFRRLGCGIGEFLQRISLPGPVAIGGDGRTSGKELRDAFVSGLPSEVEVLNLGILGTPAIAVATGFLGGAVGIALTASHNPATDNGIKFFDSNGRKWSSEWESLLEELLAAEKVCPEQTVTNVRNSHAAALFTYKEWWLRHFSPGALEGLGVVLDMANGATASYGAAFLESLGAAVIPMGNCPDGQNINGGCGSQWPEALAERVRAEGVPWGLAVDGDGDRALLCDSTGTVLAGEHLLARLAHLQFSKYPLVRPLLITTVQANGVLERHLPFEVLRTPVGDRSVAGAMARSDCLLGGEPSGHVLLPDWDVEGRGRGPAQRFCTADGLLAGALFLSTFLGENNRQLSANWNFPLNPTAVRSVAVVEKFPLEKALHFQAKKKQVAAALGENGRLLVRYSGTENRLRFLVEATDVAVAEQFVEELTGAFTLDMAHLSGEKGSVEKIKVGGAALEQARRTMEVEAAAIRATAERLTEDFTATVELLLNHRGKIILCGVGKSGFIAQKIAATFTSTGTQAIFLHPTEALHGDLGIYTPGDPTIFLSRSGTTDELLGLIPPLRHFRSPLIAIVGNGRSPLARQCDFVLEAYVDREADPLDLVPTTSAITALAMGDALAAALMAARDFQREDFARFHPGGQLGRNLILRVADVMHPLCEVATAFPETSIRDVVVAMTEHPLGACCVVEESGQLRGIITDGDVRRLILQTENLAGIVAGNIFSQFPRTVGPDCRLGTAIAAMESGPSQVGVLPVASSDGVLVGLIRLHDTVRKPGPSSGG